MRKTYETHGKPGLTRARRFIANRQLTRAHYMMRGLAKAKLIVPADIDGALSKDDKRTMRAYCAGIATGKVAPCALLPGERERLLSVDWDPKDYPLPF